ncbi:hypothetical protein [Streptomyces sp. NPDC048521]|uniref:hypothetical protein n=1 Tax=Streptomyces sp. NPDC048521 TaxID=3365566 RepID=UPI0037209FD9
MSRSTRSRPSHRLLVSAIGVVAVGVALPMCPLAGPLGFRSLPLGLVLALALMVVLYLVLIEGAKHVFYTRADAQAALPPGTPPHPPASHPTACRPLSATPDRCDPGDTLSPGPSAAPPHRDDHVTPGGPEQSTAQ